MRVFAPGHQERKEILHLRQMHSDESQVVITIWFNRTIMYGLFRG